MIKEPSRKGLPPGVTATLVVAMFVLPIIIAWWFAVERPSAVGASLLNRGALITPPIDIRADPQLAALTAVVLGPGEWAMVYFTQGQCAADCLESMAVLDTIYSLLGHDQTRTKIVGLSTTPSPTVNPRVIVDRAAVEKISSVTHQGSAPADPRQGLVFLDWRGRLMLYFADTSAPADIKKDLKRLLRGSEIR